ncbi:unnamed protein product, partial [Mesorhabditis spiculigera]
MFKLAVVVALVAVAFATVTPATQCTSGCVFLQTKLGLGVSVGLIKLSADGCQSFTPTCFSSAEHIHLDDADYDGQMPLQCSNGQCGVALDADRCHTVEPACMNGNLHIEIDGDRWDGEPLECFDRKWYLNGEPVTEINCVR